MTPEAQSNLFTPFFSTKPHGQGIGLTLVQEILAGHGFDYALERTARGTLNIFRLPLSGPATPSELFGSRFNEAAPRFSPDGRAMAFTSMREASSSSRRGVSTP